jgi:hypothetical protein
LGVEGARIELPDTLVPTGKEEINDVWNDCWGFGEETLFTVQEEVLILATRDERRDPSQISTNCEV